MAGPIDWDALVLGPIAGIFGQAVTYTPKGGAPLTIEGVFDEAYREITIDQRTGVGMNTVRPVLGVQLSQLPVAPSQGDQVIVTSNATTYVVKNVEPDSHGWALLKLNEAG